MTKFLRLTAILMLATAIMPLSTMRRNRSHKHRQKRRPPHVRLQQPALHRQHARSRPRALHRQRVPPQQRGSRHNARLRKGQPLRNAPRKEPQRQRARPRRARCNIKLRKGRPRRNEQKLQRVRPHHAPLIHRLGQRRRRPARLCRPLQPQHQRARSCAASNARSAHYERKKIVNCEPFRPRSARRNSRKSISSVNSARSSGYILTPRRSRKAWYSPMLKCSAYAPQRRCACNTTGGSAGPVRCAILRPRATRGYGWRRAPPGLEPRFARGLRALVRAGVLAICLFGRFRLRVLALWL